MGDKVYADAEATRLAEPTSILSDPAHFRGSSFREKLIEHVFLGELLRCMWRNGNRDIEVMRVEVDRGGYDLVLESGRLLRHVQLKSSHRNATTSTVNVHTRLADKTSGCVIWIQFDATSLDLGPFQWFGGLPGQPLPALPDRPARHTKGDSTGYKAERPHLRVVPKAKFTPLASIEDVVEKLFGPSVGSYGTVVLSQSL